MTKVSTFIEIKNRNGGFIIYTYWSMVGNKDVPLKFK